MSSFSTDDEGRKLFELPEKRDVKNDSSGSEDNAPKRGKQGLYHRRLKRKSLAELKPGGRAWKRERRKQLAKAANKLSKQSSGTSEELQASTSDLTNYQHLQASTSDLSAEFAPSVVIQPEIEDHDSDGSSGDEMLQEDNVFLAPEDLENYADVSSSNSSEEEIQSDIPEELRLDDEAEQEPDGQQQDGGDGEEQMNTDEQEQEKEQENDPVRDLSFLSAVFHFTSSYSK